MHKYKEEIITDTAIAKELEIQLRTLSEWKKNRVTLYNHLVWSFKAKELLREIDINNDDLQVKLKELLKD